MPRPFKLFFLPVLVATEILWRHLQARGTPGKAAVQQLLLVFAERLSRSLHARSQPTSLWLGKITHTRPPALPFSDLTAHRLATVGFHLGSPEDSEQFQFNTTESTLEAEVV